jgi:hypothetical protein
MGPPRNRCTSFGTPSIGTTATEREANNFIFFENVQFENIKKSGADSGPSFAIPRQIAG